LLKSSFAKSQHAGTSKALRGDILRKRCARAKHHADRPFVFINNH
jgi:hypothetical protein